MMTFREKLWRLTATHNRAAISRQAGLSDTYLNATLYRKSRISIKAAVALAKVLGVEPGWLMDDAQDWPPVRITEGVGAPA